MYFLSSDWTLTDTELVHKVVPGDRLAKDEFEDWFCAAFDLSIMLSSLTMGDGIVVSPSTSHITNNRVITCGELWWSTNLSTCFGSPSGLLYLAIIITAQSIIWDVSIWVHLSIHGKKMTSSGPLTLSSGHCLRLKSFHDSPKRISYFLLPFSSHCWKLNTKFHCIAWLWQLDSQTQQVS